MNGKIVAGALELKLRDCVQQDFDFVYERMYSNLGKYFEQIPEGWSRQKFRKGFIPERITIIEHEDTHVGFYDFELDKELYLRNIHISDDYRNMGIGTGVISLLRDIAKDNSIKHLKAKVFKDNAESLCWLKKCGFRIAYDIKGERTYVVFAEV